MVMSYWSLSFVREVSERFWVWIVCYLLLGCPSDIKHIGVDL